jgi:hypothetical protein
LPDMLRQPSCLRKRHLLCQDQLHRLLPELRRLLLSRYVFHPHLQSSDHRVKASTFSSLPQVAGECVCGTAVVEPQLRRGLSPGL